MTTILITGGTGYIGSHTAVELIEEGIEVVIVDNFSNSSPDVLGKLEKIAGVKPKFYEGDVLDADFLRKVFAENKIDAVIHFAAYKAVNESIQKPLEYYENNVTGTLNLLKVMKEFDCKKIVFSSSATVYGMNNPVPLEENMPTSAINPYGYTKIAIERFLLDIANVDAEFSPAILRYFNPIGAHKSGLIGELPNGIPNNLLPYIMQVATGKLEKLNVYGDDYDTVDGTGVRDYIHVVDIAKGHVAAVNHIMNKKGVLITNLGTGKGHSVLEVVKACEKVTGKTIPVEITKRREGDIATCYAKTDYAKKVIGWEAEKTLDEMCEDSWNFMKQVK